MEKFKISLKAILIFHCISTLNFNIGGLASIPYQAEANSKLTVFAAKIIALSKQLYAENVSAIEMYAGFTGTNKAYEFFSPNVSSTKTDFFL